MDLKLISESRTFGGKTQFYSHDSRSCQSEMRFSVFVPSQAEHVKVPVLYWLSGLSCSEENFMIKAGAQRLASELGLMLVAPDTSPRGLNLPHDSDNYDFGVAAGFYVNATQSPWSTNYRMYEYVSEELPQAIHQGFHVDSQRESIFGHSMGGHGALVLALRQPERYASVSAFAPICAPSLCPWGKKAFTGYLGPDTAQWERYDAHKLIPGVKVRQELFVDQGSADKFLPDQLMPEVLQRICVEYDHPLRYRLQEGYDHSYYFIASFVEDHLVYHSERLR